MSQSVTTGQCIPSAREHDPRQEHVPKSSPDTASSLAVPLIDSVPTSPSLYSDTDDDQTQPKMNTMLPHTTSDQAPALPEKSARRMSRMLGSIVPHKLPSTDQQPPLAKQSAPHDVYLSSEEDASSSADDFSDFEFDSSSEDSEESSTRRSSQEDTARLVSVVFSGKPSIVDLPRRSISPSSSASDTSSRPPSRLRRISALSAIDRRASMCSSPSGSSVVSSPAVLHPPRTSSMLPSGRLVKQKPLFLSIDPFASKPEEPEENEVKPRPSTGVFKRTLSLVRKRSRPSLNSYYSISRDNLANMLMPHHMEQVREESSPESASAPAPPASRPVSRPPVASRPVSRGPVTYHDIVTSAKRRAQTMPMSPISPVSEPPTTPLTPNGTRQRLRFSSARRLSIRA
ncbi:hypothetical protein BGZ63DRAFT_404183 [Mariannaea sp. PMI_226]|nr:hypothetical protein BGZ63DRAFT_404183 [Mariannaea sp. PMI_226]